MDERGGRKGALTVYIFTWYEEMECELSQFDMIKGAWAPNALNSGTISAIGLSFIKRTIILEGQQYLGGEKPLTCDVPRSPQEVQNVISQRSTYDNSMRKVLSTAFDLTSRGKLHRWEGQQ